MPQPPRHPVLLPLIDRLRRAEAGDAVWIPASQPGRESRWGTVVVYVVSALVLIAKMLELATERSWLAAAGLLALAAGIIWVLHRYGPKAVSTRQALEPKATEGWEWNAQARSLTRWLPADLPAETAVAQESHQLTPAQDWSLGVMQGSRQLNMRENQDSWVLELRHARRGPVAVLTEWQTTSRDRPLLSDLDWYTDLLAGHLQIRRSGGRLGAKPATMKEHKE